MNASVRTNANVRTRTEKRRVLIADDRAQHRAVEFRARAREGSESAARYHSSPDLREESKCARVNNRSRSELLKTIARAADLEKREQEQRSNSEDAAPGEREDEPCVVEEIDRKQGICSECE